MTPVCIVPLGWPKGRYGPTTRKPVDEVVHLDAYGNRAWLESPEREVSGRRWPTAAATLAASAAGRRR